MVDPLDVRLEDAELLEEVELTSNLIIAANAADRPLSPAEIDAALGVEPPEVGPKDGPESPPTPESGPDRPRPAPPT